MDDFNNDKYAASNRAANESRTKWWAQKAALVNVSPYPPILENIEILGTMLKIGKYCSCALYFSAAKQEHVEKGYSWSDQLEQGVKSASRSCLRGIGPDRRCSSFDLMKVFDLPAIEPCTGGPRFPKETIIVFCEVEASVCTRADVQIDKGPGCGVVSFWLSSSNTDPKGNCLLRRHGCTCDIYPNRCPAKAAKVILDYGTLHGATEADPFLSTEDVKIPPTKQAMIDTFRLVARGLLWKDDEVKAVTCHILRSTGAQYLARCGIEFYKIQLFCRWGSDATLI